MGFGDQVEWYEELPSTMETTAARGREGAPEGLLVVAERQTAGRGRLGRHWESPEGGIWLSLLLKPEPAFQSFGLIGICFAIAAAESASHVADLQVGVKWPNDIMVGDRKLGGLLAESHVEGDKVRFIVIGLGMNVNIPAEGFPAPLRDSATSLLIEKGTPFSCKALISDFLERSEPLYRQLLAGNKDKMFEEWNRLDTGPGKRIKAVRNGEVIDGQVSGIDPEGALLVECPDGLKAVSSGEVEWL
ncbi:MAG: biotin--[acetyl-CoA-carboxylase] ligase [Armatimonadetes bacterium]|nr:biotin--[acetyl-CoA-carboxylase] ligase [Armatimonadota bacterium]NIM23407.1 biotin--[acetyl-CoA-carboxylase] ligase [Armatimonadota bacterium]NIM67272.1 biotin--[acetyl-CoA-carboxylase] ligase [Armatimonadota bacterium]NIM75770.1 biotin--[acetyl-CoA-carboxylase] ligase [Armatimonadota bacterium]NIN05458.1 biotin--[acetyl-CoA-carboxylase] ligase [Armatimonadota bacterium]